MYIYIYSSIYRMYIQPYYNTGYPYSDMGTEYGHPVIYGIKRLNNILKSQ